MGELLLIGPAIPALSGAGRSESPNVIGFASRNAEAYQAFAAKVRERAGAALRSMDGTATPSAARPPQSIPAQIRELADLHAAGVLTDEEFSAMKAELLARM